MINISDFLVDKVIYQSHNTVVYQGKRLSDNVAVVIKALNNEYPDNYLIEHFENEYQLLKELDFDGIPRIYSLEKCQNGLAIIMEDFNGVSLKDLLGYSKTDIKEFLDIAIRIVDVLDFIHSKNIIHKDLNSSNILLNREEGVIKVIDFGISAKISSVKESQINTRLDGTLPYISPEQTGRMNKSLDYRTDFYSLGITFYEFLNGELPFHSEDPSAYVHFHMAKKPIPLSKINSDIPEAISNIIMKMLEKMADNRYQSCSGLRYDLVKCREQLSAKGKIEPFTLGSEDFSEKFRLTDKIYGRDQEIERLLSVFRNVSDGSTTSVVLVGGYSGVGKTSLINEIHKPIVERQGYFISGKFDQFKRNIPYSSIVQALEEMVQKILVGEEDEIDIWKDKILKATGKIARIIIDVIPDVELIIGEQPEVPVLPQEEAQNRFNRVFMNFIRCFANKNHPLVIFLDDVQWADSASVNLLEMLISDIDTTYIMFIGAYRDNEVSEKDMFFSTMNGVEKSGVPFERLMLNPLEIKHVKQIIDDSIRADGDSSNPLAKLCHIKTQGNPFFLNQFLISLYDDGFITYDAAAKRWVWDIDSIRNADIMDNVVDLMISRIRKLSRETQNLLKLAACIGNQFDLRILSLVEGHTLSKNAEFILEAIREGLILSIKGVFNPSTLSSIDLKDENIPVCRFGHDRIQQAAYSMIEDDKREAFHHKIYRIMVASYSAKEVDENIFDIVNQLQFCTELIMTDEEKLSAANILFKAGKKAAESMAYEPSYNYFMICMKFLNQNSWEERYETTFAINLEVAKAAYLYGDFPVMEQIAADILENSKTLMERVQVYKLKIYAYIAHGKPQEAIYTGLHVLKLLGVTFPKKPTKLHIAREIIKTKLAFVGKEPEYVNSLPKAKDPYALAINEILAETGTAAFFSEPNLFPLIGLRIVHTSLKYGNTSYSCLGYGTYGIMLCGVLNDIEKGYRFGKVALASSQRFRDNNKTVYTELVFNVFIKHWKRHARETLETIKANYSAGMESGEIKNATISAYVHFANSFTSGCRLQDVEIEGESYLKVFLQHQQKVPYNYTCVYLQSARNLMGKSDSKTLLISHDFHEDERILFYNKEYDATALALIYYNKQMLSYIFGDYKSSLENSGKFEDYIDALLSTTVISCHNFLDSLARLALYHECSASEKKHYMKIVRGNQKKLKKWADICPENNMHRWSLVEAEIARINNNFNDAFKYYDKAIMFASANEYVNEEAMANELAAGFFLDQGVTKIGRLHISDAIYCYRRWGADAKADDLQEKYIELLNSFEKDGRDISTSSVSVNSITNINTITHASSAVISDSTLDLNSFIKAASVITGEIVLEKLLANLMKILIENAGADRGVLILRKDGDYFIEAEGNIDGDQVTVLQSTPISDSDSIPKKMIKYVGRVRENLVLNDVLSDEKFNKDRYIQKEQPHSILCAPLIHKGNLIGVYYLENSLSSGVFTEDRLKILQLLSSQIAISIDNASLYEKVTEYNKTLEEKVKERTSELTEAYKKIEKLALTDPLTKLSNRRHILDRIDHEIKRVKRSGKPFGIILCDIDHFKQFNDSYGHDCGDFVLVSITKEMKYMLRNQDHVSRWGGEEFLLILPDTDLAGCGIVAEKIRQRIAEENFKFQGMDLSVTLTLGVTVFDNTADIDSCIKDADNALYQGKEKGRNQVVICERGAK